ncbi:hypothetical protein T484DRAFT_1801764 [Baffinella frigidus]|nr:hypothetical protein T484DRAFT_1801764 [Cryptophyta sp. CCMP2293]
MYMNGLGVDRNYTKAKEYFDEAAKHNIPAAFNALGYMYYKGVGVAKNLTLGEMYYKKAADLDDAEAAFDLAALYQEAAFDLAALYQVPFRAQG